MSGRSPRDTEKRHQQPAWSRRGAICARSENCPRRANGPPRRARGADVRPQALEPGRRRPPQRIGARFGAWDQTLALGLLARRLAGAPDRLRLRGSCAPRVSHRPCAASSHERRPRVASSSLRPGGLDRHCCRERIPANVFQSCRDGIKTLSNRPWLNGSSDCPQTPCRDC
jgi:hypothetical protein